MKLHFFKEKCIGCRLCQLACSAVKENVFNPTLARLRIASEYSYGELVTAAALCNGCLACQQVCPTGAIASDKGMLSLNPDLCAGCGECAAACPEGVIIMRDNGRPLLCDLCQGEPACVDWCPHGALSTEV